MQTGTGNARWSVMLGIGMVVMGGCQTENNMVESPSWLSHMPGGQHEVCAVGVSGPTYHREDAMARSEAQAMAELSRAWEVKIKSDLRITERGDNRGAELRMKETSEFSSDVLLKQAQVKEQWIHPGRNERYGARGTVYTLACMPIP